MNSKKNPVVVMGNENGSVITVNENNPEQGSIWLSQSVFEMDHLTGFVNKRTRNAWLQGSIKNVLADLSLTAEKLNMTHLLKPIYKVLEEGNQSMKWIKQYKEGLSIEDIMKFTAHKMIHTVFGRSLRFSLTLLTPYLPSTRNWF